MFYVLYPFVTCLLTLPRIKHNTPNNSFIRSRQNKGEDNHNG
jgi:hypothetical protein